MSSYPTKGSYWGANHVDDSAPPAATKGAYYYGTAYIKKDIRTEKVKNYDGATEDEAEAGMSTLGSCITNTSNTTNDTEATVGSLGSDDSFFGTDASAATKDKKCGMVVADVGGGTKDKDDGNVKVLCDIGAGTRDKGPEELESTKTLKARGTQGGGGNGIFH